MTPEAPSATEQSAIRISDLSKRFGKAWALAGVNLDIRRGEVHGLVGENGSGKSTIVKILAGYHAPNAGTLEVEGSLVSLPLSPGQPRELGVEFVHQDLGLIPSLTVVENLRLEEFGTTSRWLLRWRRMQAEVGALLQEHGVDIDPTAPVSSLSPVERTLVAIIRAAEGLRLVERRGGTARMLVLDEPTVFLPREEVSRLFELIDALRADGLGVLFITHNLDEVLEVCQRITVLRDGHSLGTMEASSASKEQLIKKITGRPAASAESRRPTVDHDAEQAARISVSNLAGGRLRGVTFSLSSGEALGVTGLAGSGFELVPYLLFGAVDAATGTLEYNARTFELGRMTPALAVESNIALIPGDRQRDGIVGDLTLHENLTIPDLPHYFRGGRLHRRAMVEDTKQLLDEYGVRPADPFQVAGVLSGGNQQKAVLAKWLHRRPGFLMCHEPTQGVDIGARSDIHEALGELQRRGTAVLFASSDHEEVASLCGRVLVIHDGQVASELSGADVTKAKITELCLAA